MNPNRPLLALCAILLPLLACGCHGNDEPDIDAIVRQYIGECEVVGSCDVTGTEASVSMSAVPDEVYIKLSDVPNGEATARIDFISRDSEERFNGSFRFDDSVLYKFYINADSMHIALDRKCFISAIAFDYPEVLNER